MESSPSTGGGWSGIATVAKNLTGTETTSHGAALFLWRRTQLQCQVRENFGVIAMKKPVRSRFWFHAWLEMIAVLATTVGFALSLSTTLGIFGGKHTLTLEEEISTLTKSLNDSARLISDIEQEISQRQALVERLQRDADEAKKLSTLNSDQVAAVAQALRGELRSEDRSGFWVTALTNLVFAILGASISEGFRVFRRWRLMRGRSQQGAD